VPIKLEPRDDAGTGTCPACDAEVAIPESSDPTLAHLDGGERQDPPRHPGITKQCVELGGSVAAGLTLIFVLIHSERTQWMPLIGSLTLGVAVLWPSSIDPAIAKSVSYRVVRVLALAAIVAALAISVLHGITFRTPAFGRLVN
jgi:hypothetical protein